ncbi:MAG: histone deacetylase [Hadesarchaea archaeon]|nr:histone deacetylase [Hadesarchaea archaeon]
MTTGLVFSEKYLEHDLGPRHPEKPERLNTIVNALKREGLWGESGTKVISPTSSSEEDIELAHDPAHVRSVKESSAAGIMIDLDTPTNENTFDLALLSAGGTINAFEGVANGNLDNAYALVRPPGHHATRDSGGGFCYFNNIAIGVEKLRKEGKIDRAMILDFDSHHGNGTQDIFYDNPHILYMSLHQDGRSLYPGSGFTRETGTGEGEGYTVNVPFPPNSSDQDYASAMREIFVPLVEQFEPQIIAVSAGFDAHREDPLTRLGLSTPAYSWITNFVKEQAKKTCNGRSVFVLEGGYSLDIIGKANVGVVKVLTCSEPISSPPKDSTPKVVRELKEELSDYWEF